MIRFSARGSCLLRLVPQGRELISFFLETTECAEQKLNIYFKKN